MAVIVRAGGAAQIVRNVYLSPNRIFPDGIPKPNPDTYFLTPTGRVDLVEEQLGTGPAEPFVVVSSIPSRSLLSFCRVVDFIAAVAL